MLGNKGVRLLLCLLGGLALATLMRAAGPPSFPRPARPRVVQEPVPLPLPEPLPEPPLEATPDAEPEPKTTVPFPPLPTPPTSPLDRPLATPPPPSEPIAPPLDIGGLFVVHQDPPPGFAGRSGVAPTVFPADSHFIPVEDRWRIGFPEWDRYGKAHPLLDDYPYDVGVAWNPFKQNVLKGDYPILGQNTFLEITAVNFTLVEPRLVPSQTSPFESTRDQGQFEFFGNPDQLAYLDVISLSVELFHGDASFKPKDWAVRVTPVFSSNNIALAELAQVSPNIRKGIVRERTFFALQEWFVEKKLADLSPDYDFLSVRAGSQFFVSDFRGFIFSDTNRAVRLFGTLASNRVQFNLACFLQQEKDTNTLLNTFNSRDQQVVVANVYQQDFIWPGYTAQLSLLYNHDAPRFLFDRNTFLARPDPVGIFTPHDLNIGYLGFNGDGHINRINVSHAFYWAFGRDSNNPLANRAQDVSAFMAAVELSYDRDYARFRTSYFFSSGDGDPNNRHATGFDSILDQPNFAGTFFSYWGRQRLPLFGVGLKQNLSLIPDLRSSKAQGQSNFVNPGLHLANLGFDLDLTPKLKLITNGNLLWFDKTASLETFLFQGQIDRFIGADLSVGVEYRPLLNNNLQMLFGLATLIPGVGLKDLYDRLNHDPTPFVSGFAQMSMAF